MKKKLSALCALFVLPVLLVLLFLLFLAIPPPAMAQTCQITINPLTGLPDCKTGTGGGTAPTSPATNTFSTGATSVTITHNYGFTATALCFIGTRASFVPYIPGGATTTTSSATTVNFLAAAPADGFCDVYANGGSAGTMTYPGAGWAVSTGSAWDTSITPGTGMATFVATPSSANLRATLTDESGTGAALFAGGNIGAATGTSLGLTGGLTAATVSTGTSPPAITAGTGGVEALGEGTAPSAGCPAAGVDCVYADSTAHALKASYNNDTASQIARYSDALSAFAISPLTTRGDLLTVNSTPALARLALGAANTVLHGGATDPSYSAVVEADITLADNTTNNASTSNHGFLKKLDNSATNFMNGQGNWTGLTLAGAQFANQGTTTTVLHGNASGNPSFGAIVNGDIAANAVDSAKMAVVNTRRVCDISVGDTSGSALANAALGPQKRICFIPAAATVQEINVAADAGTPNVIVAKNSAGTVTNLLSSALATAASGGIACAKTSAVTCIDGVTTASATLQNGTLAAGDYLELVSGTAGGTAKFMTIHVVYTVN